MQSYTIIHKMGRKNHMKRFLAILLFIGTAALSLRPLEVKSLRIGDIYTTLEYKTYSEYLSVMNAGSVEVNGLAVALPENLMVYDEITCMGVFESFQIEVYDNPNVGPYFWLSYLAPGCRTTVLIAYGELEEEMEVNIPVECVGERFTDIDYDRYGTLRFDKLYYRYSERTDYQSHPIATRLYLRCVIWFENGCKFHISWDETEDTSPLFDKLTEEQFGEMEAFREGLLSKEDCIATMEAHSYRPGLLGTGMKIEEPDASVPEEISQESSSSETASPESLISDNSEAVADQPAAWVWVTVAVGAAALAACIIVIAKRKK